jgi:hypothetical protein
VAKRTVPHEIRPVNASVLAFEAGGKMVLTPLVRRPRTKLNPFMPRAVDFPERMWMRLSLIVAEAD